MNADITGKMNNRMSDDNPGVSIIFPTYNEKDNIIDLISETGLYILNHVGKPFEFIVVDDDSPDKTWSIVQEKFRNDAKVRVVRRVTEKGLSSAIWRGIQEARGSVVAWMDCDFSMPPYKLAELINKVYEGYDIAVGSRFIKGAKDVRGPADSWTAVVLSRLMNYFISFVLKCSFKDYTSGFVAARKKVFADIKIRGEYGEYFIDFIYNVYQKGYRIIELPYYCIPRRAGSSKTGLNLIDYLKRGSKYILLTLKLKFTRSRKDK